MDGRLRSPLQPQRSEGEHIDSVSCLSWGANSYGQLGQGHKVDQLTPGVMCRTSMPCSPPPRLITGGGGHSIIVGADGSLWVCGSNCHGQLGLGHREDVEVFTSVTCPPLPPVCQAAGGWDFTVACSEDGDVYTWGSNAFHQLGRETTEKWCAVPGRVELPPGSRVVSVAAGLRHALALTEEGSVYAWGHNRKGQAGHVTADGQQTPKVVPQPCKLKLPVRGRVIQVVAGSYHSGVLTDCHEVCMWGCNKFGQTSQNPRVSAQAPPTSFLTPDSFGGKAVTHIECGWTHNLALTGDGTVYSWGRADYGQLGRSCDGSCDHIPAPVTGAEGVERVVCGSEHCLALTDDGRLLSWGWNEHGMCGTGDESNVPLPVQVALPAKRLLSIGCGAGHSFTLVTR